MPTKDGRVGFALIGMGFGASRCPMVKAARNAQLVAVADFDRQQASRVGAEFGCEWTEDYRHLLTRDDVDVVCVYTPSGTHLDVVREVAAAGKNVLTTKPLEITTQRCDDLIAACAGHGVKLATEFYARYQGPLYATHQAVSGGLMGRMVLGEFSFKCYRGQDYYDAVGGWRGTWKMNGGGVMANQAVHAIDQALWLLGDVDAVCATVGTYTHDIETEDTAAALLRFKSGALGMLTGTTTFHNDLPVRVKAYGGGSFMRVEVNGEHGSSTIVDGKSQLWKLAHHPDVPSVLQSPASNVFEDYANWVLDSAYRSPTLGEPAEARKTVELVEALYRSAEIGGWVKLSSASANERASSTPNEARRGN